MENGHGLRNFLLLIVGLVVVGAVAWWVVKALISVALYLLGIALPVLVVGGVVYLVWRSRRSLTGGSRRRIDS
jgi:threonine/homoserine/homoserine lactone efflux protein